VPRLLALDQVSFNSIANNFLRLTVQGKSLDADVIAAKKYMAMTAGNIQDMFKQTLRPDGFVTAVKGPRLNSRCRRLQNGYDPAYQDCAAACRFSARCALRSRRRRAQVPNAR
jgi:hypothetical protein